MSVARAACGLRAPLRPSSSPQCPVITHSGSRTRASVALVGVAKIASSSEPRTRLRTGAYVLAVARASREPTACSEQSNSAALRAAGVLRNWQASFGLGWNSTLLENGAFCARTLRNRSFVYICAAHVCHSSTGTHHREMAPRNVLVPFAAVAALLSASAQASLCVGATGIMGRVCGALDSKRVRRERRERELDGPRVRRARGSGGSYGYGGEIAGARSRPSLLPPLTAALCVLSWSHCTRLFPPDGLPRSHFVARAFTM